MKTLTKAQKELLKLITLHEPVELFGYQKRVGKSLADFGLITITVRNESQLIASLFNQEKPLYLNGAERLFLQRLITYYDEIKDPTDREIHRNLMVKISSLIR